MRTVGGYGDTLPLLGPVPHPVEADDGLPLQDVEQLGGGVAVARLSLARLQGHQSSPGMAEVSTVSPHQLVTVILHLQSDVIPTHPFTPRLT